MGPGELESLWVGDILCSPLCVGEEQGEGRALFACKNSSLLEGHCRRVASMSPRSLEKRVQRGGQEGFLGERVVELPLK